MYCSSVKKPQNFLVKYKDQDLPQTQSMQKILESLSQKNQQSIHNKGKLKFGHLKSPWNNEKLPVGTLISFNIESIVVNSPQSKFTQKTRTASYSSFRPDLKQPKKLTKINSETPQDKYFPDIKKEKSHKRIYSLNIFLDTNENTQIISQKSHRKNSKNDTKKAEKANYDIEKRFKMFKNPEIHPINPKDLFAITGWDIID